ncbi:hypothetical protein FJZ28_04805 [Candidatus Peregrinibacteria bacterium]|nr:hypothetical protein [Candidatus Peregrinibacteria bacterium]
MNKPQLVVAQPDRYQNLLDTIALIDKVTETIGEDRSGDMGGAGGAMTRSGSGDASALSARAQALANLPAVPAMRAQLKTYIESEVKQLRREVRRSVHRASRPGSAYSMNQLYAKIRRLNALLAELMEASYEVLKRVFVRVFIDKQSVV